MKKIKIKELINNTFSIKSIKIIVFIIGLIIAVFFIYWFNNYKNKKNTKSQYKDYNIIIVGLAPLRYDALGCNNPQSMYTPIIDKFAEESIVFSNAYSVSGFTIPSVVSMLSSLYPFFHKINQHSINYELNDNIVTLPAILQKNNYKTILFDSRNYLSEMENILNSFDHTETSYVKDFKNIEKYFSNYHNQKFFMFMLDMTMHAPYLPETKTLLKFIDKIRKPEISIKKKLIEKARKMIAVNPELIFTERAIYENKEIFNITNTKQKDKLIREFLRSIILSRSIDKLNQYFHTSFQTFVRKLYFQGIGFEKFMIPDPVVQDDIDYLKILYYTTVNEFDEIFGTLMTLLKKYELDKKTIVIFMSFHGELLAEYGMFQHGTLYNEVIHIPFIMKIPGLKNGAKKIINKLSIIDIMPTLLDILGIKGPETMQGISLIKYIKNGSTKEKRDILALSELIFNEQLKQCAIISGNYLYLASYNRVDRKLFLDEEREELYDISDNSLTNIAKTKMQVTIKLRKKLVKKYKKMAKKLKGKIKPDFELFFYRKDQRKR